MARWPVLALAAIALAIGPPAAGATAWNSSPTTRVDAGRTGFMGGGSLGRPPLQERWRVPAPWATSVVAADGLVFVATSRSSVASSVTALDGDDGSVRWTRPTTGAATLALGGDRLVVRTAQGDVTALAVADGRLLWTRRLAGGHWLSSSPVVAGGLVYVDNYSDHLYAFDLQDGSTRWKRGISIDAEVAIAGGQVLDGHACGGEALAPATGERLWARVDYCNLDYERLRPASDGGRLVTGQSGILDASGGALLDRYPMVGSGAAAPSLAGDLLVHHTDTELRARSLSGRAERWTATTPGGFTGAPLVVDAVVYQGTATGAVEARDVDTGTLLWRAAVGKAPASTGVESLTAADGRLLVEVGNELVAFSAAAPSPAAGLRVLTGPDGATTSTVAALTFTAPGALRQTCALDAAPPVPCAGAVTYDALADGPHAVTIRSVGADGTVLGSTARGFTVDTTGPEAFFGIDEPPAITRAPSISVTTETVEGDPGECRLDEGAWRPCAVTRFDGVADGAHVVLARGRDRLGNLGPVTSRTVVVDTTPPEVTIVSSPPARTRDTGGRIEFRVSADANAYCTDEPTHALYSDPCGASPLELRDRPEGPQEVSFTAVDRAGNSSEQVVVRWTVDRTAPRTRITLAPDERTTERRPAFTVADDGLAEGDVHECRVDRGPWTPCDPARGPWRPAPLEPGPHEVAIRAVDDVGNAEADPPSRRFEVEGPPVAAQEVDAAVESATPAPRGEASPGPDGAAAPAPGTAPAASGTASAPAARRALRALGAALARRPRSAARYAGPPGTLRVRLLAAGRVIATWRGVIGPAPRRVRLHPVPRRPRRVVVELRHTTPAGVVTVVRRRVR